MAVKRDWVNEPFNAAFGPINGRAHVSSNADAYGAGRMQTKPRGFVPVANGVGDVALGRERERPSSILHRADARAEVHDALRLLQSRVIASLPEDGHAVIAVCSAIDGEGKTTVAVGLTELLADEFNRQTLLVDANLNQPQIHRLLETHESPGLKDCLDSGALMLTAIEWTGRMWVMPAGASPDGGEPTDSLDSPVNIFKTLRSLFKLTIVDMPAMFSSHSNPVLPHWADAIVFVVKANSTPSDAVGHSMDLAGRERIVGVVLNGHKSRVPSWLGRLL